MRKKSYEGMVEDHMATDATGITVQMKELAVKEDYVVMDMADTTPWKGHPVYFSLWS